MRFYVLAALVALASLVVKGLFLCFVPSDKIPPFTERILRFIPPAALAALVAPPLFYVRTTGGSVFSPVRLLAGLGAFIVALYSRNVIVTIISGMAFLGLFHQIFG